MTLLWVIVDLSLLFLRLLRHRYVFNAPDFPNPNLPFFCRYSFKTADYRDFFVNHLSHWDHRESDARQGLMAGLVERECERRNREPAWPHFQPLAHRIRGGDGVADDAHAWRSVALVPFWGGSASESGGNSHSNAKRSIKVAQIAGTVCSALKSFRAAAVGVCSAQDRNDVLAALAVKWGLRPWAAVHLPSLSLPSSLPHRDASTLRANMKHLKLPPTTSIEALADVLRQHPAEASKLHSLFDLNEAVLVNGSRLDLRAGAELLVLQFDCSVGVHLPFHLLQAAQALMVQPTQTVANATVAGGGATKKTTKAKGAGKASASTVVGCQGVACGGGGVAAVTRGALLGLSWRAVDYVYFTEADQVTFMQDTRVLSSLVAMLNATNYVAPQRMTMSHGAAFLQMPGLHKLSVGEATQAFWQKQANSKAPPVARQRQRRRRLSSRVAFSISAKHNATPAATDKVDRARRRLFMPHAGERPGAASQSASELFYLENECRSNSGERGYLGPAGVHVAHEAGHEAGRVAGLRRRR